MRDATTNPGHPRDGETHGTPSGSHVGAPWCTDHHTSAGDPDVCYTDEVRVPLGSDSDVVQYAFRSADQPADLIHVGLDEDAGLTLTVDQAEQVATSLAAVVAAVRASAADQPLPAAATRTVTETTAPCDHFPCDYAYSGKRHRIVKGAPVRHLCRSSSDMDGGWSTGIVSFEHVENGLRPGAWQTYLQVDSADMFLLLGDGDVAERLAFGLLTSARRALEEKVR